MEIVSKDSKSSGLVSFERRQLYKWTERSGLRNFKDRIEFVKLKLARTCNVENFESFAIQLMDRWVQSRSMKKVFERRNEDWLNGTVRLTSIHPGKIHQKDSPPEAMKKVMPVIFAKEELLPEDAVFDNDLESVCSVAEGSHGEMVQEVQDRREPEQFVEFKPEARLMILNGVSIPERVTYTCNVCSYSCFQELDLKKHRKIHHNNEVLFTCNQCGYHCHREYELEVHKVTKHILSELYHCSKCDYFSVHRKSMALHQAVHLSLGQIHCDACEHQKFALNMSKSSKPARAEPYLSKPPGRCCWHEDASICNQSSHSKDVPLHCDYSRKQDLGLQKYKKLCMHQMAYACDRCKYSCHEESDIQRRLLSHRREKGNDRLMIYACNLCSFRCRFSDTLKNHIMTHLSEETTFSEEDSGNSCDLD